MKWYIFIPKMGYYTITGDFENARAARKHFIRYHPKITITKGTRVWPSHRIRIHPDVIAKEKRRVYDVLSRFGPDVDINRIGKILPRLRKKLSICEVNTKTLFHALSELGMFGPKSDILRGDGDKYF